MSEKKKVLKNVFFGIFNQILLMSLAIVIPRLFILAYGSEVNGLFLFIGQVFSYSALLEVGLGVSTIQALYRPIGVQDRDTISSILVAAKVSYKRISLRYLIGVFIFATVYSLFVNSELSRVTIFLVILLQGLSGVINFYFLSTLRQLFIADGKSYLISNLTTGFTLLTYLAKIVLIYYHADIVLLQFGFFLISFLQIIVFIKFFKKQYPWIDFTVKPIFSYFNENKSILIHQISGLIFSSTNIIVLSLFCDLTTVSIYSTYNLIVFAVYTLISTTTSSLQFVIGHTYHTNQSIFLKKFETYNLLLIILVYFTITVIYFIFNPFIYLYTKGADVNYVEPILPLLFCIIQLLDANRMFSSGLIVVAGFMKKTVTNTIIEASINLICSIVLVQFYGIRGVLIGTIIALLYRSNDIILFVSKHILKRSSWITYKPILVNLAIFIFIIISKEFYVFKPLNLFELFIKGFQLTLIVGPIFFIINYFFFGKQFVFFQKKKAIN